MAAIPDPDSSFEEPPSENAMPRDVVSGEFLKGYQGARSRRASDTSSPPNFDFHL